MNYIESLRKYLLLSQRELGANIGIGQPYYFRIEHGELNPPRRLGIMLNYLCWQLFSPEETDITSKINSLRKEFGVEKSEGLDGFKKRMLNGFYDVDYSVIDEGLKELFPDKDSYFGDPFVGSYCYENPASILMEKERIDWLSNKLKEITTPREMEIFELYLDKNNLSRVGDELNISRERVRQVVSLTLKKLRAHLNRQRNFFGEI